MKLKANQLYFGAIKLIGTRLDITDGEIERAVSIAKKLAELIPDDEPDQKTPPPDAKDEKFAIKLEETYNIFNSIAWPSQGNRWTDIDKRIRSMGIRSSRRISEYFKLGIENGIIFRGSDKRYYFNAEAV